MQVLRVGQIAQEAEHEYQVRPDEDALCVTVTRKDLRKLLGERSDVVVQARRVRGSMPAQKRRDDARDHEEDEVGLAAV